MYNGTSKMVVYVRVRVYACTSVHVLYGMCTCLCVYACASVHVVYGVWCMVYSGVCVYECMCCMVCVYVCVCMYECIRAICRVSCVCAIILCRFVGSCLATKVFIGNLLAMGRGWVIK